MSATIYAYMTEYSEARGQDLHAMDPDKLVAALSYSSSAGMNSCGWLQVGTVEAVVKLDPREKIIGSAVAVLRAEQQKLRAELTARDTEIERKIAGLLCIEGAAQEVQA